MLNIGRSFPNVPDSNKESNRLFNVLMMTYYFWTNQFTQQLFQKSFPSTKGNFRMRFQMMTIWKSVRMKATVSVTKCGNCLICLLLKMLLMSRHKYQKKKGIDFFSYTFFKEKSCIIYYFIVPGTCFFCSDLSLAMVNLLVLHYCWPQF